jgi:hypothetical protein
MLASELGVRLMLLIGDTVPLPASYEVVSALTRAQVTNDARSGDGFQLTFALARDGVADYSLLGSGALAPWKRVVLSVVLGVVPEVLIDGVITHQQVTPGDRPGEATMTVQGRDISKLLDLEERNEEFPNQPDFLIVTRVLARYAQYGLVPLVTPTTDVPIMLQRVPRQHETDFALIQRLARSNGYVFYVQPVTVGVNTAYWGPETRAGVPQPALTTGMGAHSNLRGIHFSQDASAPVSAQGTFVEPITRTVLPIPPLPSLRIPPLAASATAARRTTLARETGNENPARAALSLLATATNAPDAVTAQGELDGVRYGHVLRARGLVGVRGAGYTHDGLYYVRSVTHALTVGSYTQSFALSREGTGSLAPAVIP